MTYYRDMEVFKLLTPEETIELAKKGDKKAMVEGNLRLVLSIVRQFNRSDYEDLIQEGNIGLLKAVEKFDYTRGYKFSTMASWWIYAEIKRSIEDKAKTVRVPAKLVQDNKKLNYITAELERELEREPLPEDLAAEMGIEVKNVEKLIDISRESISLEEPMGEGVLADFIEDKTKIEDEIDETLLKEEMQSEIDKLLPREKRIIELIYGFDGHLNAEEIASEWGITRQRVQQILHEALGKLKVSLRN